MLGLGLALEIPYRITEKKKISALMESTFYDERQTRHKQE